MARSNTESDIAAPIVDSAGNPESIHKMPPSAATTTASIAMVRTAPLERFAHFSISANIPITRARQSVAGINLFGSIADNPATANAITPIATVNTIRFLYTLLAPFVAAIINAIIPPSIATATMPLARLAIGINPSSTATPAKIAIAIDRPTIIFAAASVLLPFPANLVAAINPVIIPPRKVSAMIPLASDLPSIPPTSCTVRPSNIIAAPTLRIIFPAASALLPFPANLVAAIRPTIIAARYIIADIPLASVSNFIFPRIPTTAVIKSIAVATLRIVFPAASALLPFPANLVAAIRPVIIPAKIMVIVIPTPSCS